MTSTEITKDFLKNIKGKMAEVNVGTREISTSAFLKLREEEHLEPTYKSQMYNISKILFLL